MSSLAAPEKRSMMAETSDHNDVGEILRMHADHPKQQTRLVASGDVSGFARSKAQQDLSRNT